MTFLKAFIFSSILHSIFLFLPSKNSEISTLGVERIRIETIKIEFKEELSSKKTQNKSKRKKEERRKTKSRQDQLTSARAETTIQPHYPEVSKEMGEEGEVLVEFSISKEGEVSNILILKSSGFSRLDREVIRSIKKANFIPSRKGKFSQNSTLQQRFIFKLD